MTLDDAWWTGPLLAASAATLSSESLGFAPAVEYNWSSTVGVIFGAKLVTAGRNTDAVVIPVMAINVVY